MKVGFALTSEFQEAGRGFFHRVSRQNPEYKVSK
ncbi:MAG: PriCT-2 domain-containing protein [Bacteroidales bacterium]|nr:PriCT-2 domain-containing protein [Bacteroidales bacterium]